MPSSFLNTGLIAPYGGSLVDLLVVPDQRPELVERAGSQLSVQLPARVLCDLELLATGAFSPLDRFMCQADYRRVVEEMRLADGTLFPVPVTLPLGGHNVLPGQEIALRNAKNNLLGWMRVDEVFEVDEKLEMLRVAGTLEKHDPLVAEMRSWGPLRASGPLHIMELPRHHDFPELRGTPMEVRSRLAAMRNPKVLAFQSDQPLDQAQEEFTKQAAAKTGTSLLLEIVAGESLSAEIDHYTRVRIAHTLVSRYYEKNTTLLNLLPLALRWAGPRATLWNAIIQRNFGATHLLVEGDPDGVSLLERHEEETGVRAVRVPGSAARLPGSDRYRPEATRILETSYPPTARQGFCVWFTGLPSSGKSTVAEILAGKLLERGRQVTLLDGDVVRTHLSRGLGFSAEDRDINIRRIGFVASEITRHHGVVITAAVSPYRATRNQVRAMMRPGNFLEVFVDTPASVCEERDVKGFYAQARAGRIKGFTGVDDPYEPPLSPEITLQTVGHTPEENAEIIIRYLISQGFLENA